MLHFPHLPGFETAVMKGKALLAESVTEDSNAAIIMKTASSLAQQSSMCKVVHLTFTDGAFIFNSFTTAIFIPQEMDL